MNATTRFDSGAFATPANVLTLSRILLAPPLFFIIVMNDEHHGASWAAFAIGMFIAITDNLDGKLARRQGTTRSGAFLDPLADKVVVLGVMVSLVAVGRYWWFPVAIVAVRELAVSAWRTYWARRSVAIPARRSAKYKTLVQGVALALAVMPPLEDADGLHTTMLWIAVAFTTVTGVQYALDGQRAMSRTGELA
ncbi:MAG TPA: CDP-diacylglycerol--glycerol-3-phosphate 3-phosphatidyltransferase [Acidimicrobiales bacterium]